MRSSVRDDMRLRCDRLRGLMAWTVVVVAPAGCSDSRPVEIASPFPHGYSVAVAPALNFSGAAELDPVRVADLFASELADVDHRLTILPVSRTVAVLAREGRRQIESPAHAYRVARRVGADALIVLGVTEYRPYPPMVVGMAVQVYGRVPSDFAIAPGGPDELRESATFEEMLRSDNGRGPKAQIQRVYNAAHEALAKSVRNYAEHRDADKSPYGWRRYMVSQELFLRFVCWDAAANLVDQERKRLQVVAAVPDAVEESLP